MYSYLSKAPLMRFSDTPFGRCVSSVCTTKVRLGYLLPIENWQSFRPSRQLLPFLTFNNKSKFKTFFIATDLLVSSYSNTKRIFQVTLASSLILLFFSLPGVCCCSHLIISIMLYMYGYVHRYSLNNSFHQRRSKSYCNKCNDTICLFKYSFGRLKFT